MSESQLTPKKSSESVKLVGTSSLMTSPNLQELKFGMMKFGAFLDEIQLNNLDAKQFSFAKSEDGAWEMPDRKVVMEVETVPGV